MNEKAERIAVMGKRLGLKRKSAAKRPRGASKTTSAIVCT